MSVRVPVPDHVPAECVIDFDIYNPMTGKPDDDADIYSIWRRLQQPGRPDFMWSPYNGGHWIATRAEDIQTIFSDYQRFSSSSILIPRGEFAYPVLPQETDPPVHRGFRSIINPWFTPKNIATLEQQACANAVTLIEGLQARGECEFIEDFARPFPIAIVMAMVDLPMSDRHYLQQLSDDQVRHPDVNRRRAAYLEFERYVESFIELRRDKPGDDLISAVVHANIDGRPLTREEVFGMVISLIGGGLDTVSATLGHIARFLAGSPGHRHYLLEYPEIIPGKGVEELLRRFGVAAPARTIPRDLVYKGIEFKEGEMVQTPTFLHNWDERRYPNPMEVDFDREDVLHGTFGFGAHRCPGSNLARVEVRIFLQEWLPRIPDFQVQPGATPQFEGGLTLAIANLPLVWDTNTVGQA